MAEYIINGRFLTQQITGIQRYALEITRELDKIVDAKEIAIVTPEYYDGKTIQLSNIEIVKYGRVKGIFWEQISLHNYLKKSKKTCINFCNVCSLGNTPGITAIHDLMFKMYRGDKASIRIKLSRVWHTFLSDYAIRHEKYILTPSEFSKTEIMKYYPQSANKIKVIRSGGWEHITRQKGNEKWNEKFPMLPVKNYFFSLSTRSKNKNGTWVIEVAKKNPNHIFAVAGRSYEKEGITPPNVFMLGYVTDEDIISLMSNCKAFVFPSLYEGFGLPPMEALALGANIIVSDIAVMHEVYGESAYYIDPHNTDIDIESIMNYSISEDRRNNTLNSFSWEISAMELLKLARNNED